MTKKEHQPIYVSPKVETMEIRTLAMLCQSGGIEKMERDDDEGDLFN